MHQTLRICRRSLGHLVPSGISLIDKVGSKCGFSRVNNDTYITFEILFCCNGSAHGSNLAFRSDTTYYKLLVHSQIFLKNNEVCNTLKEILNAALARKNIFFPPSFSLFSDKRCISPKTILYFPTWHLKF